MTRYEQGFMNKCAEYGLGVDEAVGLMKVALSDTDKVGLGGLAGMGAGAAIGVHRFNKAYGPMENIFRNTGVKTKIPKITILNKLMTPAVSRTALKGGLVGTGSALAAVLLSRLFSRNRPNRASTLNTSGVPT